MIGIGCNQQKNRIQGRPVPSLHAEIGALRDKSRQQTKGSDLFLVRLSKTGLAASKPCDACLRTLQAFGVHKVYYSTRDGVVVEKVGQANPYFRSFGSWKFNSRPIINPVDE